MTLRCMDALKTQMLHLIQAMGFRQMMVAVTLFALTCLIWLVLSLPGKKRWKIPVALAGAAGILSLALPWMRHTFTTWPAALLFPLVCCTAMILPITALQSIRTALLAPALILAPLWRTPLHTLLSRKLSLGVLLLGAGQLAAEQAVALMVRIYDNPSPSLLYQSGKADSRRAAAISTVARCAGLDVVALGAGDMMLSRALRPLR